MHAGDAEGANEMSYSMGFLRQFCRIFQDQAGSTRIFFPDDKVCRLFTTYQSNRVVNQTELLHACANCSHSSTVVGLWCSVISDLFRACILQSLASSVSSFHHTALRHRLAQLIFYRVSTPTLCYQSSDHAQSAGLWPAICWAWRPAGQPACMTCQTSWHVT